MIRGLLVALLCAVNIVNIDAFTSASCRRQQPALTRANLFDKLFGEDEEKRAEKDRMMAEQQAILDMRKNKSSRAAYFERVEEGRKKKQEEVDMWCVRQREKSVQ